MNLKNSEFSDIYENIYKPSVLSPTNDTNI